MANRLKMRILLLLSLVYINCDYLQAQTTIPRFEEGERVVFVGNSITHGGHYHSFIWLYYMTRFPDKPITIMNAGIGGESAWDMKDRLDYDVFNRKPTYVTLTFGMNDTGYDIKIKCIKDNEFRIQIYVKETKVLDYHYYQEGNIK